MISPFRRQRSPDHNVRRIIFRGIEMASERRPPTVRLLTWETLHSKLICDEYGGDALNLLPITSST
jgi:hypothetical protein